MARPGERSDAVKLNVTISAIYIGIASGLLIFVLQTVEYAAPFSFGLFSAGCCICSIVFHMFAGELFMLAIWHPEKISVFAWYGSVCYGIGQAFLFIGMGFVIRLLDHQILSVLFLFLILLSWGVYYAVRITHIPDPDHSAGRWYVRGGMLLMYLASLVSVIKS